MQTLDRAAFLGGLIGLPWAERAAGPDAYDCWGLAAHVQRALHGRSLPWSADVVPGAGSVREVIGAIRRSALHRTWAPAPHPADGDLVLMYQGAFPSHVGVWIDGPDTGTGVLHANRAAGVVFETLADARADWARLTFHRHVGPHLDRVAATDTSLLSHVAGRPTVIRVHDLFDPMAGAEIAEVPCGSAVWDAAAMVGVLGPDAGLWAVLNGEPLLRAHPETREDEWHTRRMGEGDLLWLLPPLPEGGEDGGGSAVLASIAAIAISIAAPFAVGLIAPGLAGTLGGKLLAAGIAIGAQTLVGQFVPTPSAATLPDPEPTYSFSEVRNAKRPTGTIPRPYGTMLRVPDLLADPWAEFIDNEQFIHILLCVGQGDHDLLEFGVSDTAVWKAGTGYTGAIQDVQHELIRPGGSVTLFPAAMEVNSEVGGAELPVPEVDPEGGAPAQVTVGPFVAVSSARQAGRLVFDFAFPRGLFSVVDNLSWTGEGPPPSGFNATVDGLRKTSVQWRVETRLIDDLGQAAGFWQTLDVVTLTAGSTTPQRLTKGYDVPVGRYEVQVTRLTPTFAQGSGAQDQLVWSGLRAHLVAETALPGVTALALRIKADAGSTAAIDQIYARTIAVLPRFDTASGQLVTSPTESIDAAILDIARAPTGLALTDAQIDLPQLLALARTWAARGDVCCTVVEGDQGAWEVLETVCTAGRTRPQFVGATLTFVRDEWRTVGSRLVTQSDMVRGSLEVIRSHFRREQPNVVTMEYRDREGAARSIECRPAGVTDPRPAIVSTKVMVDAAQVWREGLFMAASNNLRRVTASWVMLAEGKSLIRGQVVNVSHPRPGWGRPARLVAIDWPVLHLSAAHDLQPGQAGWVNLKMPDGGDWGPVEARGAGSDPFAVAIDEADFDAVVAGLRTAGAYLPDPRNWMVSETDFAASPFGAEALAGEQTEPTRVTVGKDGQMALRCLILEVSPRDNGQVEVLAIQDVRPVHDADLAPLPDHVAPAFQLANPDAPVWAGVTVRTIAATAPERAGEADLFVDGPAVSGAVSYRVETATDLVAADWSLAAVGPAPMLQGPVLTGTDIFVRVAASGPVILGTWSVFQTDLAAAVDGISVAIPVSPSD